MSECREKIGYEWDGVRGIRRRISDKVEIRIIVINMKSIRLTYGSDDRDVQGFFNKEEFLKRVVDFERKNLTIESLASMTPYLKSMVIEGETV